MIAILEITNFEYSSLGLKGRNTLEMGEAHFMYGARMDAGPERHE